MAHLENSSMLCGLERLEAIARLGVRGELADPADFEWLLNAVAQTRHGTSFEVALEMKSGVGQRKAVTRMALLRRNILICERVPVLWPGPEARAARELESALRLYEATAWRRERILDEPPSNRSGSVQELCWRILREWPQPLSAAHIRRILGCARNAPFHAQPEM